METPFALAIQDQRLTAVTNPTLTIEMPCEIASADPPFAVFTTARKIVPSHSISQNR
jgi:hypothetical protein